VVVGGAAGATAPGRTPGSPGRSLGPDRLPPAGGGPTAPLIAYGNHGAEPRPSYSSPADYTVLWWDPTAKGPDEEGVDGTGLYRYADGGKRYASTVIPRGDIGLHQKAGSVTSYATPPVADRAPSYPPWPGSPTARPPPGARARRERRQVLIR